MTLNMETQWRWLITFMQHLTDSTTVELKQLIKGTIESNFTLYKALHNLHEKEIKSMMMQINQGWITIN